MFIVRYPTGVSITYNRANYLKYTDSGWEIYTANPAKDGFWVASIMLSAGAIIEASPACKIENPAENLTAERALGEVTKRIRSFHNGNGKSLSELKRALAAFDARRLRWKEAKA